MKTMIKPLIFVAATLLSAGVLAEEVNMPAGEQGMANQDVPRPHNGQSMDQVSAKYGEPDQKIPAVGNPPISRWVYGKYTVYFENDRVIHSVLHPAQ